MQHHRVAEAVRKRVSILHDSEYFQYFILFQYFIRTYRNRSAAFVDFIERLQRLWPSIEKAVGRRYVIVLFDFLSRNSYYS